MGLTGATTPVTLAGTLVQHVAENLSGVVIAQLAKRGAPVIFGGSPSGFDMRRGTTPMGAIETMMIDIAYAQIGKSLGLPTHAYMALSDAKVIDAQAGLETGMGAVLAALAGVNVVSGPGMLDFESTQSLEKLVIDNEICGMAYRLIEGVAQRDEPLALGLFEGFAAGTQFLTMPHTREWYRVEHFFPAIADRETYDGWAALGKKTAAERAHDEVNRLLGAPPEEPPRGPVRRELEEIMRREGQKAGLRDLPDLSKYY
jgi:trimethylamine--corrinoid protein Co-methyltransferase